MQNKNISAADKIRYLTLEDLQARPETITVLYGDTGKRKTTTACGMIKKSGLLISADGSWKVLKKKIHAEIRKRVTNIVEFQGFSQLPVIKYENYDTAILDPVSEVIDYYLDLLSDKGGWGVTKGAYRETIKSDDPELKGAAILHPIDYRVTRDKFRPVFRRLFEAPVHIIFTAHVNEPIKGLSVDGTLRPAIPNSTWKIIGRHADLIGYISPKSGGFNIDLRENNPFAIGKSRIEGIEGQMNLDDFVKKYRQIVLQEETK